MTVFQSQINMHGAPEITPQDFSSAKDSNIQIVDVRRPDEYTGELGHIAGAKLCTLETELETALPAWDKTKTYVFVCRSGARSSRATLAAQELGFKNVFNLKGGMILWNELSLPITKDR